ncbi:GNAT family N-acetyltransferase [Mumia sp. DW29H23]|uniref:GNAT family N-acetyltransferase n=1 Tax=Mumia sp. DW29H23 TaxID=3421241 RepID=UPI003D6992B2
MTMTRPDDLATDLVPETTAAPAVRDAIEAAGAAARRAGVHVRQLDSNAQFAQVSALFEVIWRPDGTSLPVTGELLRALTKAGGYVGGAYDGDELVGACMGFFAPPAQRAMHSHIAGVSPRMRGRNVGFALKVHQRAWSLAHETTEISWTFDPLVRRNAYFNLSKLAATPAEYLANFYGPMNDRINGSDDTDRLLVSWDLASDQVAAASGGRHPLADAEAARAAHATIAVGESPTGAPVVRRVHGPTVLVAVPSDIEALRAEQPRAAAGWRTAVRDALGGMLADGARIRGFDRSGYYIVDREGSS